MARKKPVDNEALLREIKSVRREMMEKFEEISPYIDTLKDIKSAGRIFAWIIGALTAVLGVYLMLKQLVPFSN